MRAALRSAVLRCAVLCYAVPCCDVLRCAALCCACEGNDLLLPPPHDAPPGLLPRASLLWPRGVVCLVEVLDGRVQKGDRITAASTGACCAALRVLRMLRCMPNRCRHERRQRRPRLPRRPRPITAHPQTHLCQASTTR